MCPDEYNLFDFMFDDKIYYDKVLPMGCSASCEIFEKFSKAIQWLLLNHFKLSGLTQILDDFNFVGPAESYLCRYGLESFFTLAEDIILPVKHTKTVLPTTCALVHGVEIDTIALELRLPQDTLCNLRSMLSKLSKKRTVKLKEF